MATVDNSGKVTGVKVGKAVITATANGIIRECEVTVKTPTLSVASDSYEVKIGKCVKINAYTVPTAKIKYNSMRTSIATVSAEGKVTGVKKGTAIIMVTANGCTKYVKINVSP